MNSDTFLDSWLAVLAKKGLQLYPHQEEAVLSLLAGHHVILNTPTGSGKSLVSEAHLRWALARGKRGVYVSPIKALVNEKFFELCDALGAQSVGLLTGDATVNAEAAILCCTAEVLSQLSIRGVFEPDAVVLDEFHFFSDRDRGIHWQLPLLTLPKAQFLLMSATLGDVQPFIDKLDLLTQTKAVWVQTDDRPVPLEFEYRSTPLVETIADLVKLNRAPIYLVHFAQAAATARAQDLLSLDFTTKDEKKILVQETPGTLFTSPFGKDLQRYLRHGIGVHHAGLLPKYRILVERLAREAKLKIICGTDTLGVGINVPIRTVLFTQLCKFNGQKSTLLTVRDFQQIAGRAGRKGFDTSGTVVAQAPEHVADNLRAEQKAAGDPKKLKKLVKRRPPERGYVPWDEKTFERLRTSRPEPLESRFPIDASLVLQALSRPNRGDLFLRACIENSFEPRERHRFMRHQVFRLVRALRDRGIISIRTPEERRLNPTATPVVLHQDLQEDFSLHHALSLYLLDSLETMAQVPATDDWMRALEMLSLVEAVLENPMVVLHSQGHKAKSQKIQELRAQGLTREERDEALLEFESEDGSLPYPKPLQEFIDATLAPFLDAHPWIPRTSLNPKSVARDLIENGYSFSEYIREYHLERAEGVLLRYLNQVISTLNQGIPDRLKTETIESFITILRTEVRRTDQSLEAEWNRIQGISAPVAEARAVAIHPSQVERILKPVLRNTLFSCMRILARNRLDQLSEWIEELPSLPELEATFRPYRETHSKMDLSQRARGPDFFNWKWTDVHSWSGIATQRLCDPDSQDDWELSVRFRWDPLTSELKLSWQNLLGI